MFGEKVKEIYKHMTKLEKMENLCKGCAGQFPVVAGIHIVPGKNDNIPCVRPKGCPTKDKFEEDYSSIAGFVSPTENYIIKAIETVSKTVKSKEIPSLEEVAKRWALDLHRGTNHMYGIDELYEVHLRMSTTVGRMLARGSYIPENKLDVVMAALWLHDSIEDCRISYNDVKMKVGEEVAEIVFAVTNLRGKNRAERGGPEYYKGIRETKYASFVKGCDRLANYMYSIETRSRMTKMYEKEMDGFFDKLDASETFAVQSIVKSLIEGPFIPEECS